MKARFPLTVFFSSTQLALKIISLLLISTTVGQPLTLEMYMLFNLLCLSGFVAWITWFWKKKKKERIFFPTFAAGRWRRRPWLVSKTPGSWPSLCTFVSFSGGGLQHDTLPEGWKLDWLLPPVSQQPRPVFFTSESPLQPPVLVQAGIRHRSVRTKPALSKTHTSVGGINSPEFYFILAVSWADRNDSGFKWFALLESEQVGFQHPLWHHKVSISRAI